MAKTKKQRHEEYVQSEMGKCVHFRGIQHAECKAGINLREIVGGDDLGWAARLPCLLMDREKCMVTCASRRLPTREEAEAEVEKHNKSMARTLMAIGAAHEDAEKKGLKRGNGGVGSIPCPVCTTGTLSYSVASVNGHMWGKCNTKNCISWME